MQLKQCLREIYNFSYIKKLPKTSPKKQEKKHQRKWNVEGRNHKNWSSI